MNYAIEVLFIIGIIAILWVWLAGFRKGTIAPLPYKTIRAEALPSSLESETIYICGEDNQEWFVAFLCPCGCRETIQLSVLPNTKPKWELTKHIEGTISLHPSVWRTKGCKSHFFVQKGHIRWAE